MTDLPIACELSAADVARRRNELLPGLIATAEEAQELPNGFRWRFVRDASVLGKITSVIEAERTCCRFLRFRLTIEPAGGPVWLDVTGPEGTATFLAQLMTG